MTLGGGVFRHSIDPKIAARDPEVSRVIQYFITAQSFPNVPLFPCIEDAESKLVSGLSIAADEIAIMRRAVSMEGREATSDE